MTPLDRLVIALLRDELSDSSTTVPITWMAQCIAGQFSGTSMDEQPRERIEDLVYTALHGPGPLLSLEDGRAGDATLITKGVRLAHRLTRAEIDGDRLELDPDLSILTLVAEADGGLHTADGWPLAVERRRVRRGGPAGTDLVIATLRGPAGWLRDWSEESIVLAEAEDGFLRLHAHVGAPGDVSPALIEALEAAADAHPPDEPSDGTPTPIAALQGIGLVDGWWPADAGVPFGDLITASTLERSGDLAGRAASWERLAEITPLIASLSRNLHLTSEALDALAEGRKAWAAWRRDPTAEPSLTLSTALHREPELGDALLDELRRSDGDPEAIGGFLAALRIPNGPRAAGPLALRARWALIGANVAEAERLARAATSADPFHHPGVEILAELAANRGDLRETLALLRVVRTKEDEQLAILEARQQAHSPGVGRNDPCPCGSGRKYKQCHLGRSELPAAHAVAWLIEQARDFTQTTAQPDLLSDLLDDVTVDQELSPEVVTMAVIDSALFDHGWLARFITDRRPVLSDEQRTLAESWLDTNRPGAYRVTDVRAGEGAVLTDIATGEVFTAGWSRSLAISDGTGVIWARIVPARNRWWTTGGCRAITQNEVGTLGGDGGNSEGGRGAAGSDPRSSPLRWLLGDTRAEPVLAPDGSPQLMCRGSITHTLDTADLRAALDGAFDREVEEGEDVDGPGASWVRRRDDGTLIGRVDSFSFAMTIAAIHRDSPDDDMASETRDGEPMPDSAPIWDAVYLSAYSPALLESTAQLAEAALSAAGANPETKREAPVPWERWESQGEDHELIELLEEEHNRFEAFDDWDDDEEWEPPPPALEP